MYWNVEKTASSSYCTAKVLDFELLTKLSMGSSSCKSLLVLAAVSSIKPRKVRADGDDNTSISPGAARPFTSSAYSTEDMKRKEDRKNGISDVVSNAPEIEFQAKLTMLGAAKNKKKAGRSIEGKVLLPDKC